jgi:cobalt-zinc-cadmium resistance protein CzcA
MIRRLVALALSQRLATLSILACAIAAGVWCWINLKKTAYPDVGDTEVVMITTFPGRAALEVEQQITLPLRAHTALPLAPVRIVDSQAKTVYLLSAPRLNQPPTNRKSP